MNWNIPEAVWPIPAGRVKERPWWWCRSMTQDPEESTHTLYFMQRRDGAQVPVTLDWHYAGQRIDALSEQVTAGLLPHLEAYDLEHPRPRPPYRAGQVWGDAKGNTWQISEARVEKRGLFVRVSSWLTPMDLAIANAALLFDPLDPNAAPWSPE